MVPLLGSRLTMRDKMVSMSAMWLHLYPIAKRSE